jgi:hypothetical protein
MISPSAKILAVLLIAASPALTGCKTDGTNAQAAAADAPAHPPARHEVALQCWATVDQTHKSMGLDQRADFVNKCIDDRLKGQPAPKG